MVLEPGSLVDRYTVTGPLGEGGMSVVYKVRHNSLGSHHALKVLTLSSPGLRQRLLLEGQVQASLRHPNIVPVTDVIDVNGAPGLVMEYVEGPDLDAMLKAHPLTFDQVDALARDIIGAVAAAHAKGLIHRDLKPANILLMIVDDRLVPKITDFGLAKVLVGATGEKAHTRTGAMMGTPYYMSPEQVRDAKNVGPQADVFSLGAILYEMVSRQRAFQGEDLFEVFGAVAYGRFTPVRDLVPDVPDRMETAINAALTVDPEARCRDCRELLALWNGETITAGQAARPTSPWSGELLRSAHGMSSGARSGPGEVPEPPSGSTFDEGTPAKALPAALPSPKSGSGVSVPPPRALALGVLVGGGGAAMLGVAVLAVLVVGGWLIWILSSPGPAVAVVAPVPAVIEEAPAPVEAPVETQTPVPAPVAGNRPSPAPVPAAAAPAPAVPVPVVEAPAPAVAPAPVPEPSTGALPADLDPETTKAGRREEALLGVYRSQAGATATVLQVLKTDPSPDVRDIAGTVLRGRWKDGMEPAANQAGVAWCAKSADPDRLRAQCLHTLGDLGNAQVGAVFAASVEDPIPEVRSAAVAGCRRWAERFPAQASQVEAACPASGIRSTVKEQLDKLKGGE